MVIDEYLYAFMCLFIVARACSNNFSFFAKYILEHELVVFTGKISYGLYVFHLFVIRTQNRKELQNYLNQNGIQTVIHYPIPPHKQKALASFNNLCFPITEKIHSEVLSLPISPVMTEDEVDYVVKILNQF